ncbi:MAG: transcriptional repressor LexA [Phycisphaerales bacterium]|nr:transcriptional repressor LexA [Phycisphaerales bacterium]
MPRRKTVEPRTLTPRQLQILTMIRDGRRRNGYSPTLQEVADQLDISKITVFEHVEALVRKKLLTRSTHKARSLEVTDLAEFPDERPTMIPLVGRIAAGSPVETLETADRLDIEDLFASEHPRRAIRVTGDSMIDEHICEGDFVIVEDRPSVRNGDIVVALADGDNTLKKFYREGHRVRLQPANGNYKPIYPREVEIQGVVVGVVRQYTSKGRRR